MGASDFWISLCLSVKEPASTACPFLLLFLSSCFVLLDEEEADEDLDVKQQNMVADTKDFLSLRYFINYL